MILYVPRDYLFFGVYGCEFQEMSWHLASEKNGGKKTPKCLTNNEKTTHSIKIYTSFGELAVEKFPSFNI